MDEIPPFLTVEEAGRLLRIGRTKAYDLAREWRATDGRSGLPVIDFGDLLRVPGPAIRRMLGIGLDAPVPVATKALERPSDHAQVSPPMPPARDEPVPVVALTEAPAAGTPSGPSPANQAPVTAVPLKKPRSRRALSEPASQLPLFQPLTFTSLDPETPSRS
jgi:hypothetical protein